MLGDCPLGDGRKCQSTFEKDGPRRGVGQPEGPGVCFQSVVSASCSFRHPDLGRLEPEEI